MPRPHQRASSEQPPAPGGEAQPSVFKGAPDAQGLRGQLLSRGSWVPSRLPGPEGALAAHDIAKDDMSTVSLGPGLCLEAVWYHPAVSGVQAGP